MCQNEVPTFQTLTSFSFLIRRQDPPSFSDGFGFQVDDFNRANFSFPDFLGPGHPRTSQATSDRFPGPLWSFPFPLADPSPHSPVLDPSGFFPFGSPKLEVACPPPPVAGIGVFCLDNRLFPSCMTSLLSFLPPDRHFTPLSVSFYIPIFWSRSSPGRLILFRWWDLRSLLF